MDELYKEYTLLFNGITDTIKQLDSARSRLIKLQQDAEEFYLTRCTPLPGVAGEEAEAEQGAGGGAVPGEEKD